MGFLASAIPSIIGVGASLLGGGDKSSSSSSKNQAFGQLDQVYTPQMQTGVSANNFMAGLLGVPGGDAAGADAGFKSYLSKAGYAPALQELQSGITQGAASRGLLNSGSTQKALVKYGAGLDQQFFNNYFQNLNTTNQAGLNAGQIIGNAGSTSSSTGAQQGLLGQIGNGLSASSAIAGGLKSIFSDRRLKNGIVKLTELKDGLGVYSYRYNGENQRRLGVMADEVQALRPWAIGPVIEGYATVNYGAL